MLIKANLGGWEAHRRTRDLVLSFASRVARDLGCHISPPPRNGHNYMFWYRDEGVIQFLPSANL